MDSPSFFAELAVDLVVLDEIQGDWLGDCVDVRDLIAIGDAVEFVARFEMLKVFCVELNDLRGSDRGTFPKLVCDITKALAHLKNLECVELN